MASAIAGFIPDIWSARLLKNLNTRMVYGNLCNRDYEGEIKGGGDTVKINSIGHITVSDYAVNVDHAVPEALTEAQTTLVINQQKMFNFQVDDVEEAQAKPKVMEEAMREAGYALANVADQYVASLYTAFTPAIGDDTTPVVPTANTAGTSMYEFLVDARTKLIEGDVSLDGAYAVLPAWCEGLLLKDDRFVSVGSTKSDEVVRTGLIGRAAGLDIFVSNNVPNTTGTKYKGLVGIKSAMSFADQINKTEAYRPQLRFADAVKGLHVYGAKVIRPTAAVVLTMNKS